MHLNPWRRKTQPKQSTLKPLDQTVECTTSQSCTIPVCNTSTQTCTPGRACAVFQRTEPTAAPSHHESPSNIVCQAISDNGITSSLPRHPHAGPRKGLGLGLMTALEAVVSGLALLIAYVLLQAADAVTQPSRLFPMAAAAAVNSTVTPGPETRSGRMGPHRVGRSHPSRDHWKGLDFNKTTPYCGAANQPSFFTCEIPSVEAHSLRAAREKP